MTNFNDLINIHFADHVYIHFVNVFCTVRLLFTAIGKQLEILQMCFEDSGKVYTLFLKIFKKCYCWAVEMAYFSSFIFAYQVISISLQITNTEIVPTEIKKIYMLQIPPNFLQQYTFVKTYWMCSTQFKNILIYFKILKGINPNIIATQTYFILRKVQESWLSS